MVDAGGNIRQLAQKRKKQAIQKFSIAGILFVIPIILYSILGLTGISVFIHVVCWVISVFQAKKGQKEFQRAGRADRGAAAEESTALILSELEQEGWNVEYNIPIRHWGDADAFLCSPKNNCFVVDTKSNKGIVFFDGTRLMLRYGQKIYPFPKDKDILKAARGQAVTLKEMKRVRFVTPILCFTQANLDIKTINNKVENVYVLDHGLLVRMLRKLDK